MSQKASGTFEVKLAPQPTAFDAPPHRMSIDKTFSGDMEGTSKGEMLSVRTAVQGSAGYVAMELVTVGSLHGRSGSFCLQHTGTMNKGQQSLSVTVVPDSGTDGLAGISGQLSIDIKDGKHYYTFEYTL
eukprot:TRINITY_DN15962_c0_g1_i1.p1 TRINITY_DN15962_c0_g1~~TRINITY_DN15962_c0_g1_i1.p1  ORF type:complete len:129 (+),score=19.29 TRINITY_DN15962_c0_g1_i1:32-418(+)